MLALAPKGLPEGAEPAPGRYPAEGERRARVALLQGCAQSVLEPSINAATIRLLNRLGVEVVLAAGEGCCGALVQHMGREEEALAFARRNVDVWAALAEEGLDAVIITASGCGTTIKDYGFMLREDPAYAEKARRVSGLAKDITEFLAELEPAPAAAPQDLVVAYHSACSMQHGQQIREEPKLLLRAAGFTVKDVPEGHICCGSAGTYNILQPELANALRARKVANIERVKPDLIATGNIGCMTQIGKGTDIPIVHTVELIDWATGGPMPAVLEGRTHQRTPSVAAPIAREASPI
jgi:glycolate oxidase iron-sulfur subunit